MLRLKRKLKSRSGFSLTELLVAVAILSVFTVTAVALAGSAVKTYKESTFVSDSGVLSDTVNSALSGILRYSVPRGDGTFDYEEYENSSIYLDSKGRLKLYTPNRAEDENDLLPEGAYGNMKITNFSLSNQGKVFIVTYKITGSGDSGSEGKEYTAYIRSISRK